MRISALGAEKEDTMADNRGELNKIVEKYRPVLKKFGKEVSQAAKKGEESVVAMSKMLKIQIDILGLSLQKEKLYHELGKEVAMKLMSDSFDTADLEKYKRELTRIHAAGEKKKKDMTKVKGSSVRAKTSNKD